MKQHRKRCSQCKQEKPVSEFHKDSRSDDGLRYNCKVCMCEMVRIWKANHPFYQVDYRTAHRANKSDYMANYRATHKDIAKETTYRWRASHPNAAVEIGNRRRTRKAGNGGSYTADEWK